ncbi:MAG: radical SAM protein, partial [archaeon]
MKNKADYIHICQTNVLVADQYADLPVGRIDLFRTLVYPRLVHSDGAFRTHLEVLNKEKYNCYYQDADYVDRRKLYNIWNLPAFNGIHLAAFLQTSGIKCAIINNLDSEWDRFESLYEASDEHVFVGLSTTFYLSVNEVRKVTARILKRFPKAKIVLGGAFVHSLELNGQHVLLENLIQKCGVRYLLHAYNSELDLLDLLQYGDSDPAKVRNLYLSDDKNKILKTTVESHVPLIKMSLQALGDLDLPFVNRTLQARLSSGCPFRCAFCSYPAMAVDYQSLSLDDSEAQLRSLLSIRGVRNIVFIDDTFNARPDHFKALLRRFVKMDFKWFCFIRLNLLDEETVDLMADAGCVAVYAGIESADDELLKRMNKRAHTEQYRRGISWLKNKGIAVLAAFVLGFPGETQATLRKNIEFIEDTCVDFYSLKEFYLLEATDVYRDRSRYSLEGVGNKWSHLTMNYQVAADSKLEMFQSIHNSVAVDPDTSLWHLAYLVDQGLNLLEIKGFQKQINGKIQQQLQGV